MRHEDGVEGLCIGRVTLLWETERLINGRQLMKAWVMQCECGNVFTDTLGPYGPHNKMSCGCRAKIGAMTHGHSSKHRKSPAYGSWNSMISRCSNEKSSCWKDYGGRGIKVCDRWLDFRNFFEDMGERPDGMTLDRYPDLNGNYEPGNCRWATPIDQQGNRRNTKFIEINGETYTTRKLSEKFGIPFSVIQTRLKRGFVGEQLIRESVPKGQTIEYRGKIYPVARLAEIAGIPYVSFWRRLDHGWGVERAVNEPLRPRNAARQKAIGGM